MKAGVQAGVVGGLFVQFFLMIFGGFLVILGFSSGFLLNELGPVRLQGYEVLGSHSHTH